MVILRIKKAEFDLIKSGVKKKEYRSISQYNKRLLLSTNKDGFYDKNDSIKEIKFINGYKDDSPSLIAEVLSIVPVKFVHDIFIKEDNFRGLEGECAIEINLGKITFL